MPTLSVPATHDRLIVVGLAAVAVNAVGAVGAVKSHVVRGVKVSVGVMVCAGGLTGGHGSTVLSPLNLPSVASTNESTRFEAFDSVLAVKFGSLYAPVGSPACVRGSNPSNGNGLSGCAPPRSCRYNHRG